MHRGRRLALALLLAAPSLGCGGSLGMPDRPAVDGGVFVFPEGGWHAAPDDAPVDRGAMNLCPDQAADRIDGTTCQYSMPAACTGDGIRVHVLIDGAELPQLADDGWTFAGGGETSIELHGAACDRANQSPTAVTLRFTSYLP
jgi:hypothetical protein